jgi:hypothetical protein
MKVETVVHTLERIRQRNGMRGGGGEIATPVITRGQGERRGWEGESGDRIYLPSGVQ